MAINNVPRAISPIDPETIVRRSYMAAREWLNWFDQLKLTIDAGAYRVGAAISLTAQSASLSDVAALAVTATGLYRVSYYSRVTRPASVSSSLTVIVGWTDGGVVQPWVGITDTLNVTTANDTGVILIRADKGTNITYSTAYVSVGGTTMQYSLDVRVEAVP